MYALNGIDLDNNTLGTHLQFGSEPYPGLVRRSYSFPVTGRDGLVTLPWERDAPVVRLVVWLPAGSLRAFYTLLDAPELVLSPTADPTVQVAVEATAATPVNLATADPMVELALLLRFNDVFWRSDTESTSAPVAVSSASVAVSVFPGISAPVRDAVVRVAGDVTGLRIEDSRGSWVSYAPNVPSGSFFRFESGPVGEARAFVTSSDTWAGGTEVTGFVSEGAGSYPLEITPTFTDPSSRVGRLTVTTTARAGSPVVQVRGRNAFLV